MDERLQRFLTALDDELAQTARSSEHLGLYVIGCAALVLGYGYTRQTADVDVYRDGNRELLEQAEKEFGRGTANAATFGYYLETVGTDLKCPEGFKSRSKSIP